jgi:hypothetical protein
VVAAIAGPPRGLAPTKNVARAATLGTLVTLAVGSVFALGMLVGQRGRLAESVPLGAAFAAAAMASPPVGAPSEVPAEAPPVAATEPDPPPAAAPNDAPAPPIVVAVDLTGERAPTKHASGVKAPSAHASASKRASKVHTAGSSSRAGGPENEDVNAANEASDLARAQLEASMR